MRKFGLRGTSKYVSLKKLEQIKKDNYVGANGFDYCPFEVETRIVELKTSKAEKLVFNPWGTCEPRREIRFKLSDLTQKHRFMVDLTMEKGA